MTASGDTHGGVLRRGFLTAYIPADLMSPEGGRVKLSLVSITYNGSCFYPFFGTEIVS